VEEDTLDLNPIHVFKTSEDYVKYLKDVYNVDATAPEIGVCGISLDSRVEGLKHNSTLPKNKNLTEVLVVNTDYEVRLDDSLYEFYRPFLEYAKSEKRNSIIDDLL
jgi:hypothetical protein